MAEFASSQSESTATEHVSTTPAPERLGQTIEYERFLDCVHCGLCTSACPTYLETGNENDSPRGRIYLMRAVTDGRLELTGSVTRHLELCLDCRSCETACPSGVQYGRLIEPFRVEMHEQGGTGSAAAEPPGWFERWILHGLFPYPSRLKWALAPARLMQLLGLDHLAEATGLTRLLPQKLQRMQRLLPPLQKRGPELPEVLPAEGTQRARVALFTGCVADAMFHHVNRATARILQANGCEVVIPRQQTCCGAIHYHSGASEPAMERAEANAAAFPVDDVDAIIVNVAGCGAMLRDYPHIAHELSPNDESRHTALAKFSAKVRDISEFLMELGPVAPTHEVPMTATYHDACHLCHAQQVRQQPRDLLGLVPGLTLVPLPESDICCGAAGSYNLTEPEMSDRLGQRKLRNIQSTEAEAVISGNAGCTLQIQAMLRGDGSPLPVLHPAEILARSYGAKEDG
ncbi:Lactate utilization protein A [Maioricimonas rarisocia]|uniref:Glycolate oxidase iron-sulfur subunit n=1 Tax=Maioricimonas rarisocia TaxID=2528026 RepID=A0A517Z6J2_9PLAN|nr:heterodisulfide reductase-related iron-sulfur binding cluster [Maioricimonas rarisocia]QDU38097.1 Lactate utilization protein A [Maioricimonas rarisocia]